MPVFTFPFPFYKVCVLSPRNGSTHRRHKCPTFIGLIRIIPSLLSQEFVPHPAVILDLLNLTIEATHCSTKLVWVRGGSRNEIEGKEWEGGQYAKYLLQLEEIFIVKFNTMHSGKKSNLVFCKISNYIIYACISIYINKYIFKQ